jgi:hypothetical protein
MDSISIKIGCLANIALICSNENNKIEKLNINNDTQGYDSYYTETYQLLININREDFHEFRTLEADRWIRILVTYFESKEEYEICANLHQFGYNIFNTNN